MSDRKPKNLAEAIAIARGMNEPPSVPVAFCAGQSVNPHYPTWVASKLPGVTFAPDAWGYFQEIPRGEPIDLDADLVFECGGLLPIRNCHRSGEQHPSYRYFRPIPRPTERLLEAMAASDGRMFHPLKPNQWTRHNDLATRWLTACEHSCQAEPGDGKPVPLEMGEEPPVPEWKRRIILAIQSGRASPEFLDWVGDVLLHVLESPGAVDDWVHDEADQLTKVTQ